MVNDGGIVTVLHPDSGAELGQGDADLGYGEQPGLQALKPRVTEEPQRKPAGQRAERQRDPRCAHNLNQQHRRKVGRVVH